MARVNHKLVKKLLNEKRSKITDRQFFTSRVLAGHFEDMAAAQTRRYKYGRRVRVQLRWEPKSGSAACTDNLTIHINTGHPMVTKTKGRENRYQTVCGMFAHELGHVLYTDFLLPQTQTNYMERGMWYPEPPVLHTAEDLANEKALWAYIKADPKNLEAVKEVSHHISNVLEDGYIENRMLKDFPGTLGFGLTTVRQKMWEEMGTVTDLKQYEGDGSCHIFQCILEVMLSYVKYGKIKYGDEELDDIRIHTTFDLINELDRSVTDPDPKTRLRTVNGSRRQRRRLSPCRTLSKRAWAECPARLPLVLAVRLFLGQAALGLILMTTRTSPLRKTPPSPTKIYRRWKGRALKPESRMLPTPRAGVSPTTRPVLCLSR